MPTDPFLLVGLVVVAAAVVYFLAAGRAKAAPQPSPERVQYIAPPAAAPQPTHRVVYDPAVAHLDDAVGLAQTLARRRHEDLMLKRAIRDRIETTDSLTGLAKDLGLTFDPSSAPPGPK